MADLLENQTVSEPRHPIQVVARRTGLSIDVIRAWERRYGVVSPLRSSGQRRLYSDADIRKLSLLQRATQAGRRISDIADLDEAEILVLLAEDRGQPGAPVSNNAKSLDEAVAYRDACLAAIAQFDQMTFDRVLSEAAVALSVPELLARVIAPILKQIGKLWEQGKTRVGHEHFATATIRSFLGQLIATANVSSNGPTLLVATPIGQNHELGALMAAVIAASEGWRVVYLSPNIPARDLAAVVKLQDPTAIILGITYPSDDKRMSQELKTLRQSIPNDVQLIVGGNAANAYRSVLKTIGAKVVPELSGLRDYLRKLRDVRTI